MQFVPEPEKWHAFPSCIFTIVAESIGCGAPTGGEHRGRGAGVGVRHAGSGALSIGTRVVKERPVGERRRHWPLTRQWTSCWQLWRELVHLGHAGEELRNVAVGGERATLLDQRLAIRITLADCG